MSATDQLNFIGKSLAGGVDDAILKMGTHVRSKFPEECVVGVLGYGSCLSGVNTADSLIDFYVLVRKASDVSSNWFSAASCSILPPNVYYAETLFEGLVLRSKYAVVDIDTFENWVSAKTKNPYFWARFSQPCSLVWVASEIDRDRIIKSVCQAILSMYGHCCALGEEEDIWQLGLVETYKTELRAEGPSRAAEIVKRNAQYYRAIGRHFSDARPLPANWFLRRVQGKAFSVLRLIKASFTFTGGADYLAWKISRHSGVKVELKPWQRRHPLLAAIYLLPGLLKKGAVR